MKFSKVSKFIGAGVIAASVATVPFNLPASAQTNNSAPDTTTTTTQQDVATTENDNGFDWGWLGLLGLSGLAGLAGLKRNDNARHSDADRVRSTTYR
jgi:hypothetical protein